MPLGMGSSTTVIKTADGAVGPSGGRIRVFSVSGLSDGTIRNIVLRNGAADTAQIYVTIAGVASVSVTQNFGVEGMVFDAGCFVDFTASAVNVVVTYRVEL